MEARPARGGPPLVSGVLDLRSRAMPHTRGGGRGAHTLPAQLATAERQDATARRGMPRGVRARFRGASRLRGWPRLQQRRGLRPSHRHVHRGDGDVDRTVGSDEYDPAGWASLDGARLHLAASARLEAAQLGRPYRWCSPSLASGTTRTCRLPKASAGRRWERNCSAVIGRTVPSGLVCVHPSYSRRYRCSKPLLVVR